MAAPRGISGLMAAAAAKTVADELKRRAMVEAIARRAVLRVVPGGKRVRVAVRAAEQARP